MLPSTKQGQRTNALLRGHSEQPTESLQLKAILFVALTLFGMNALLSVKAAADISDNTASTNETSSKNHASATFAGGCFWCMEPPFDKLKGVISTTSGYMGGHVAQPTYQQVSRGGTGHAEVVQVIYDANLVDYETLLHTFWRNIDPTDARGQFCDKGCQYRTEIFYHDAEQRKIAEQSKVTLLTKKTFESDIVTDITTASRFYPAEQYHQDYYQKNPIRYKYYRYACGRDDRLEQLWGKETTMKDH